MAKQQTPPRRNDVIRCENCGEDYSVTYRRCPFCDERPGQGSRPVPNLSGRRIATNRRGGGYGGSVNPVQIVMLILSLVLVIAAVFIVVKSLGPLLHRDNSPGGSSVSASQSQSAAGSTSGQSSAGMSSSSGSASQAEPSVPSVAVTGLTLNRADFTLTVNESFPIQATVTPAEAAQSLAWSSSDTSIATVDQDGKVTNVNHGSSTVAVTITAVCGDQTATCVVRCNGDGTSTGSPATPTTPSISSGSIASGTECTITNAGSGLRIRSGPGTEYEVQASATNGSSVTVLEDSGTGWYKIRYTVGDGKYLEGYVKKEYVVAN